MSELPLFRKLAMEKDQDLICLYCDSKRVVEGCIDVCGAKSTFVMFPRFSANELKKTFITMEQPRFRLDKEVGAVVCLDCGLVWTSVDVEDATRKLSKYGTDELKSRVGLD